MTKITTSIFLFILFFCRCTTTRDTPEYHFSDGYYTTKIYGGGPKKVYVKNEEEIALIYPLTKAGGRFVVDTSLHKQLTMPQLVADSALNGYTFHKKSFDVDFLTIPFKYRPREKSLPRQFNTNLNGGVYLGYRNDSYLLRYKKNVLGKFERETTHLGLSFGGFVGLGGTAMNPWVTNDQIDMEYDGFVLTKGVASIIGINKVTLGLAVGWDNLLDRNKRVWIYQGNPWVGFAFGFNLN
jgi:hypothetical protein